jgi:hypothetical protein
MSLEIAHPEFAKLYPSGRLIVDVDRQKAFSLADADQLRAQDLIAYRIGTWLWLLSMPAAFVTGFLYHWWVGVVLLVVVTPAPFRGTKTRMMRGVIYRAVEDPTFFDLCVKHGFFDFMCLRINKFRGTSQ